MSRFDEVIDRTGTHSLKWDMMESRYGVSATDGLPMWVADMDFRPPDCVQDALNGMMAHGIYGYYGDDSSYRAAVCWWMKARHGWEIAPEWIFTTHGLVNAVSLAVDTWSAPGDGVVLLTPVYHAFARVISAAKREVVECQLALEDGRYQMDFDAWDAQMTGREKLLILCSPHNPGGRIWSADELRAVADFARRHDLLLISDEIHHDLVMPGQTYTPMPVAAPEIADRLVMLTATTKTFNIAGTHTGNVIISDPDLRKDFGQKMLALGLSPNSFGVVMAEAAYSPAGAEWVDDLCTYLDGNRQLFDEGINAIPGLASMKMQATYLSWVDCSGTGLPQEDLYARVEKQARIAVNHGPTFGKGGEDFLRFNIGTNRSRIHEAVARLKDAFSDLQ